MLKLVPVKVNDSTEAVSKSAVVTTKRILKKINLTVKKVKNNLII